MFKIKEIADEAEVIIDGYATLLWEQGYKVCNLNTGEGVAVFLKDLTLCETNMSDIELAIAKKNLTESLKYMEVEDAKVLSV